MSDPQNKRRHHRQQDRGSNLISHENLSFHEPLGISFPPRRKKCSVSSKNINPIHQNAITPTDKKSI
jgi:hypothetical protein